MLKNMKIKSKFQSVFLVILVSILVMVALAYNSFSHASNIMDTFYRIQYANTKNQMEIRKDIQTINKRILVAFISNDNKVTEEQVADFDERFVKIDGLIQDMNQTLGQPEMIAEMQASFDDLKSETYRLMDMIEAGQSAEALTFYNTTFNDVISERFVAALSAVGDASDEQAEQKYQESIAIKHQATIALLVTGVACVALCTVLFKKLSRGITKNVVQMESAVRSMESGSFDIDLQPNGNDELAQMTRSFMQMAQTTQQIIADLCGILTEMSNGNFSVASSCSESYVGEYSDILSALSQINFKLREVFSNMNDIAGQVEAGSSQIADGSMALSQGATEQASTVEELAATIQTINGQIEENSEHAANVNGFSLQVAEKIDHQSEQMAQMLSAMHDIEEKSNEIEKIIKTIDDIAFQTNILALNAAVEAARAGDAGKGFAVVADEVRNLAGKSAEAAKETATLIKSTIEAVQNGSGIVEGAADSLGEVIDKSRQTTSLIGKITNQIEQEATAMNQMTLALEQISQVVQQNSATAEESSAACQELNEQAVILKQMVEKITY
ncbi:HAMP domain-containing methyl-accepting chemotaxis protein [Pygmaiobacter massiliensis]|uniref:methyl-accepting chemotaxis protein n=1 Tax=Pygmaiobacter massiliensis TaxID=1917873 RepID=UPI002A81E1E6|nr:HAMP domain-containing methyl-accepting chemotaxis protein [Pygmaiobacter massiliensis]MDY4785757.1 HAMP domain-containing methyl-accepting chemotaxis protein [Pygmaiobacter massiliensis]